MRIHQEKLKQIHEKGKTEGSQQLAVAKKADAKGVL